MSNSPDRADIPPMVRPFIKFVEEHLLTHPKPSVDSIANAYKQSTGESVRDMLGRYRLIAAGSSGSDRLPPLKSTVDLLTRFPPSGYVLRGQELVPIDSDAADLSASPLASSSAAAPADGSPISSAQLGDDDAVPAGGVEDVDPSFVSTRAGRRPKAGGSGAAGSSPAPSGGNAKGAGRGKGGASVGGSGGRFDALGGAAKDDGSDWSSSGGDNEAVGIGGSTSEGTGGRGGRGRGRGGRGGRGSAATPKFEGAPSAAVHPEGSDSGTSSSPEVVVDTPAGGGRGRGGRGRGHVPPKGGAWADDGEGEGESAAQNARGRRARRRRGSASASAGDGSVAARGRSARGVSREPPAAGVVRDRVAVLEMEGELERLRAQLTEAMAAVASAQREAAEAGDEADELRAQNVALQDEVEATRSAVEMHVMDARRAFETRLVEERRALQAEVDNMRHLAVTDAEEAFQAERNALSGHIDMLSGQLEQSMEQAAGKERGYADKLRMYEADARAAKANADAVRKEKERKVSEHAKEMASLASQLRTAEAAAVRAQKEARALKSFTADGAKSPAAEGSFGGSFAGSLASPFGLESPASLAAYGGAGGRVPFIRSPIRILVRPEETDLPPQPPSWVDQPMPQTMSTVEYNTRQRAARGLLEPLVPGQAKCVIPAAHQRVLRCILHTAGAAARKSLKDNPHDTRATATVSQKSLEEHYEERYGERLSAALAVPFHVPVVPHPGASPTMYSSVGSHHKPPWSVVTVIGAYAVEGVSAHDDNTHHRDPRVAPISCTITTPVSSTQRVVHPPSLVHTFMFVMQHYLTDVASKDVLHPMHGLIKAQLPGGWSPSHRAYTLPEMLADSTNERMGPDPTYSDWFKAYDGLRQWAVGADTIWLVWYAHIFGTLLRRVMATPAIAYAIVDIADNQFVTPDGRSVKGGSLAALLSAPQLLAAVGSPLAVLPPDIITVIHDTNVESYMHNTEHCDDEDEEVSVGSDNDASDPSERIRHCLTVYGDSIGLAATVVEEAVALSAQADEATGANNHMEGVVLYYRALRMLGVAGHELSEQLKAAIVEAEAILPARSAEEASGSLVDRFGKTAALAGLAADVSPKGGAATGEESETSNELPPRARVVVLARALRAVRRFVGHALSQRSIAAGSAFAYRMAAADAALSAFVLRRYRAMALIRAARVSVLGADAISASAVLDALLALPRRRVERSPRWRQQQRKLRARRRRQRIYGVMDSDDDMEWDEEDEEEYDDEEDEEEEQENPLFEGVISVPWLCGPNVMIVLDEGERRRADRVSRACAALKRATTALPTAQYVLADAESVVTSLDAIFDLLSLGGPAAVTSRETPPFLRLLWLYAAMWSPQKRTRAVRLLEALCSEFPESQAEAATVAVPCGSIALGPFEHVQGAWCLQDPSDLSTFPQSTTHSGPAGSKSSTTAAAATTAVAAAVTASTGGATERHMDEPLSAMGPSSVCGRWKFVAQPRAKRPFNTTLEASMAATTNSQSEVSLATVRSFRPRQPPRGNVAAAIARGVLACHIHGDLSSAVRHLTFAVELDERRGAWNAGVMDHALDALGTVLKAPSQAGRSDAAPPAGDVLGSGDVRSAPLVTHCGAAECAALSPAGQLALFILTQVAAARDAWDAGKASHQRSLYDDAVRKFESAILILSRGVGATGKLPVHPLPSRAVSMLYGNISACHRAVRRWDSAEAAAASAEAADTSSAKAAINTARVHLARATETNPATKAPKESFSRQMTLFDFAFDALARAHNCGAEFAEQVAAMEREVEVAKENAMEHQRIQQARAEAAARAEEERRRRLRREAEERARREHERRQRQREYEEYARAKAFFGSQKPDPYGVLSLPRTATKDDIQKRYRELSLKYHPDRNVNKGEAERARLEDEFKKVQAAYEDVLQQNERRGFMFGR